ncbi:MAG: PfkB family carbohydrate kinase [Inquilinaceae bacterium]
MTGPRMVHVGGAVVDFVYRVADLPPRGGEVVAGTFAMVPGGGFNQMAAAARSGLDVAYVGGHGTGPHGDFIRAALATAEISVLRPASPGIDTGNCVVMIDGQGERTFVSWPGAEGRMTDRDLVHVKCGDGDWVVASGYTLSYPDSRDVLVRWLASLPPSIPLVFDPSPVAAAIPRDCLKAVLTRTTWLSANLLEAEILTGESNPGRQGAVLLDRLCPMARGAVLRAGADGAILCQRGRSPVRVPGFAVEAVDTNGAGDTHVGVFVAALARAEPLEKAVTVANAAAAISVTRHGGSDAPTATEIDSFLHAARRRQPADSSQTGS